MSVCIVVPLKTLAFITFSSVRADLSGTTVAKHSFVSLHIPPATHITGNTLPSLFYLLTITVSSTLTVYPTPPIFFDAFLPTHSPHASLNAWKKFVTVFLFTSTSNAVSLIPAPFAQ